MARQHITKKPDRLRFDREVRKMLVEEFGAVETPDGMYSYRMNTKAGPLGISIHEGVDSPGNVMTRFDFAHQGNAMVSATVPSGKWNHHFQPGTSCDDALEYLRGQFERLRPTSLDQFMDVTALVPQAIVETALLERGIGRHTCRERLVMTDPPYMSAEMGRLECEGNVAWFTRHCEERLVSLWDSNPHIRTRLQSESGRDTAYAFVHHWLDAFVESLPDYRKKHPLWSVANEPVET